MGQMMSHKEVLRAQIMERLMAGKIDQREASQRLAVCVRQVKRIVKRYRTAGLPGLVSQKRGAPSNRRLDAATRQAAIETIEAHYPDFGPTLACEKLRECHDITLSVESTRQLMIAAGLWKPRKGTTARPHPLRERRARRGEMIQIDGSPHDWFEGRSERCTLLVFIDDATGQLMQLRFVAQETTLAYMQTLHDHIVAHGIPVALYSDKHSVFRVNMKDADPDAETQFSRAARTLGIECIHANSPQAKGRVERANQTLQDRLVKEMRLAGINDMEAANAWLPEYIADYNRRFQVEARKGQDAHLPWSGSKEALKRILSVQVAKTLSSNLSCQHQGQLFQVQSSGSGLALRGAQVILHHHIDGAQEIRWRNRTLSTTVMSKAVRQAEEADSKTVNQRVDHALKTRNAKGKGHKPAANHPWRKSALGKSATKGSCVTQ